MSQQLENVPVLTKILTCQLRGGVKIEKRENLGQCPNRQGGILKTEGGGLYFSKVSELEIALRHHPK